jgi:hypothetical protein
MTTRLSMPLFAILAVSLAAAFVGAQDAQTPVFDLYTADAAVVSGPLQQLNDDWSVTLAGKEPIRANSDQFVALRRKNARMPGAPDREHVILMNGDQIPGPLLQVVGERVIVQAQIGTGQELSLPLSNLSVVWIAAPEGAEDSAALRRRLIAERRRRDVLLLRNGDRIQGTLTSVNAETVRFEGDNHKEIPVERARVAALALNTELARPLRPAGIYGRLVLANGCRLSLASAHTDEQTLVGKTLFKDTVRIPIQDVQALDGRQGRAVYLSDLKARHYEHTPYLDLHWPYTRDTSVAGRELHIGGSTYDKGVGMHSQSRLTYDLAGGYRWFEAIVGLDDRTGRRGSAVVEVLVDGKPQTALENRELSGSDAPRTIRVPVTGAKELTLVVKFGTRGDVQNHVDWADARLIK